MAGIDARKKRGKKGEESARSLTVANFAMRMDDAAHFLWRQVIDRGALILARLCHYASDASLPLACERSKRGTVLFRCFDGVVGPDSEIASL